MTAGWQKLNVLAPTLSGICQSYADAGFCKGEDFQIFWYQAPYLKRTQNQWMFLNGFPLSDNSLMSGDHCEPMAWPLLRHNWVNVAARPSTQIAAVIDVKRFGSLISCTMGFSSAPTASSSPFYHGGLPSSSASHNICRTVWSAPHSRKFQYVVRVRVLIHIRHISNHKQNADFMVSLWSVFTRYSSRILTSEKPIGCDSTLLPKARHARYFSDESDHHRFAVRS